MKIKFKKLLFFFITLLIIIFSTSCSGNNETTSNVANNDYISIQEDLEKQIRNLESEKEMLQHDISLLTEDKKNLSYEIESLKEKNNLQTDSSNYLRGLLVNILNNNSNNHYLKKDNQPLYFNFFYDTNNQMTFCGATGYILKTTHLNEDYYKKNFYVGKTDDFKSEILLVGYVDTSENSPYIYSDIEINSNGSYILYGEPIATDFNKNHEFLNENNFLILHEYGNIKKVLIRGEIPTWYLQNEYSLKVEEISPRSIYASKDTTLKLSPENDSEIVQSIENGTALKIKAEYNDWYFAEIERKVAAEPINEGWIKKKDLGYLDDVINYRKKTPDKYEDSNILEGIDVKVSKGVDEFDSDGNIISLSEYEYWGYIHSFDKFENFYGLLLPGADFRIIKKSDVSFIE